MRAFEGCAHRRLGTGGHAGLHKWQKARRKPSWVPPITGMPLLVGEQHPLGAAMGAHQHRKEAACSLAGTRLTCLQLTFYAVA